MLEKTKNADQFLVLWLSSCVLIFAVIGHNTINIPKYFNCSRFSGRTRNLGVRGPGEKSSLGGDKIEWYQG